MQTLHEREAILEAVTFAAERFLKSLNWEIEIDAVLARLGQAAGASRIYVFQNHRGGQGELLTSQRFEWCAPGISPQIDNPDLQAFNLLEQGFERWQQTMLRGELIFGHISSFPESERTTLEVQGIWSLVTVPVFTQEQWWGFIGLDQCDKERTWISTELEALKTAGSILGAAIGRKQVEDALVKSEERFQQAMEASSDGLWDWNILTGEVYFSPGYAIMLGYQPGEFGRHVNSWSNLIHPQDRDAAIEANRDCIENRTESFTTEFRMQTKTGTWRWILGRGKAVARDSSGKAIRMIGTHTDITERKLMEETLRARSAEMEALVQVSPLAIILLDLQGNVLIWNQSAERIFGWQAAEIIGQPNPIVPAERQDEYARWSQQVLSGTPLVSQDTVRRRKDGALIDVRISSAIVSEQDGSFAARMAIITDITAAKRAERVQAARLRLVEYSIGHSLDELLQATLDEIEALTGSSIGFYHFLDADQNTLVLQTWSTNTLQNMCKAEGKGLHYPAAQAGVWADCIRLGHPVIHNNYVKLENRKGMPAGHAPVLREVVVPVWRGSQIKSILGVGNKPVEYTQADVEVVTTLADLAWDIVERKQSEQVLERRAAELEALANVSAAMRMADTRADIPTVVLAEVLALFQAQGAALLTEDAASGSILIEAAAGSWSQHRGARIPAGLFSERAAGVMAEPYLNNHADELVESMLPGGPVTITALAGAPLIANQRRIGSLWFGRSWEIHDADLRLLIAISDIVANALHRSALHEDLRTQLETLQKTQAMLIQSEKLAAIGGLVAGVAHELNNPLTSVMLFSQIMQMKINDPGLNNDLEKIVSEAQRASKIVRGLLEFSRQRPTERRPVQVNDLLHDSLDLLSYELRAHMVQVSWNLAPDLPDIMADPNRLKQVFVNIVNNAWQAMQTAPQSRTATINITSELGTSIYEAAPTRSETVIRIGFQDNGPGIEREVLDRVFDPFFTTKPPGQGTGLGLSICHGIINEHGGHIWAESQPHQGTRLIIELPASAPKNPAIAASGEDKLSTGAPGQDTNSQPAQAILVIDDETYVLEVVQRVLVAGGYHVELANNGLKALDLLGRREFQLIICDMRMPEISGPQLYQAVQTHYPKMIRRLVFSTGDSASAETAEFLRQTGAACLEKPFDLKELLGWVQNVLGGLSSQPEQEPG